MAGVNKVILVGNLGKDPEIRTLESGVKVARCSVATTESYNDRNTGQRVDQTEWHNMLFSNKDLEERIRYQNQPFELH